MFSEETLYSIALRKVPYIGDVVFRKLVSELGSAENVWKTPKSTLTKINGIGKKITQDIGNQDYLVFAEKEISFCIKNKIEVKLLHQKKLSELLAECEDAPAILYQKGEIDPSKKPISIVGTRNITSYGKSFVKDLLASLKPHNVITISGLALGTDALVHEESIKNNIATVGVLAHGFQTFYPAANKKLSENILLNNGALITEFDSSAKPDREHFIQRNRIIAGFSPATIIVETAFGGGSVSTATFANNYNRDVFALPGKITDKQSQGCNQLIYKNKASAISTIKELISDLNLLNSTKIESLFPKTETLPSLSDDQFSIYNFIKTHPNISLDELSNLSLISSHKILPILLELEILGLIKTFSGRQFSVL